VFRGGAADCVLIASSSYQVVQGFHDTSRRILESSASHIAWDREWCLAHLGTGSAIDRERIGTPVIPLELFCLTIRVSDTTKWPSSTPRLISYADTMPGSPSIKLRRFRNQGTPSFSPSGSCVLGSGKSQVCSDGIAALTYTLLHISDFTYTISTPRTLVRFAAIPESRYSNHALTRRVPPRRKMAEMPHNSYKTNPQSS